MCSWAVDFPCGHDHPWLTWSMAQLWVCVCVYGCRGGSSSEAVGLGGSSRMDLCSVACSCILKHSCHGFDGSWQLRLMFGRKLPTSLSKCCLVLISGVLHVDHKPTRHG